MPPDLHFRWTAHHVRELFTALCPDRYSLDGSSVVQITCGPRGEEPQYRQVLGSSEYFIEAFDFGAYRQMSTASRERMLLEHVEAALVDIARRAGAEISTVQATVAAIRERQFRFEGEVKKLRRGVPGSRYSLRVFRRLSGEGGETWHLRVVRGGAESLDEVAMGTTPNYQDRREYYKMASIEGTSYVVRDRLGKETFRFSWEGRDWWRAAQQGDAADGR